MADLTLPDAAVHALALSRRLNGLPAEVGRLCAQFEHDEIDRATFLAHCTREVATAIGCSRAGIWLFVDTAQGLALRCAAMHDGVSDRMTRPPDERRDVSLYFSALEEKGFVMANDASTHVATRGFFADSLKARGVRSLLAASFSVNGTIYGAFTCTEVGRQVDWSLRQLTALRQAGARASLTLFRSSRFTPTTGYGPLVL